MTDFRREVKCGDRVLATFLLEAEEAMWSVLEQRYADWAATVIDTADLYAI